MTSPGEVRAQILDQVITAIHRHAITIGADPAHGDYAASLVLGVELVITDLTDTLTPPARRAAVFDNLYTRHDLLDETHADQYRRLIAYMEAHDSQSVRHVLDSWAGGNR